MTCCNIRKYYTLPSSFLSSSASFNYRIIIDSTLYRSHIVKITVVLTYLKYVYNCNNVCDGVRGDICVKKHSLYDFHVRYKRG